MELVSVAATNSFPTSSAKLCGRLRVLGAEQIDRLHAGVLKILERTGLQIQGEFLLRALADAGCRVDFAAHRAWFRPELVERQVAQQRGRYRMGASTGVAVVLNTLTTMVGFAVLMLAAHRGLQGERRLEDRLSRRRPSWKDGRGDSCLFLRLARRN